MDFLLGPLLQTHFQVKIAILHVLCVIIFNVDLIFVYAKTDVSRGTFLLKLRNYGLMNRVSVIKFRQLLILIKVWVKVVKYILRISLECSFWIVL